MTRIGVIDHGAGNLVSMMRSLEMVGASPALVTGGSLVEFDRIVLPGVGATGPAMRRLNETGLTEALRAYQGPMLGVCVGMQLLFDSSDEDDTECLGLIPGTVEMLDATPLPHIGWNAVETNSDSLFGGSGSDPLFYFVHSYVTRPSNSLVVAGETTHGTDRFASAVHQDAIYGVQFHPERSGKAGLDVLARFSSSEVEVPRVA